MHGPFFFSVDLVDIFGHRFSSVVYRRSRCLVFADEATTTATTKQLGNTHFVEFRGCFWQKSPWAAWRHTFRFGQRGGTHFALSLWPAWRHTFRCGQRGGTHFAMASVAAHVSPWPAWRRTWLRRYSAQMRLATTITHLCCLMITSSWSLGPVGGHILVASSWSLGRRGAIFC